MSIIKHLAKGLLLSLLFILSGCAEQPGNVFYGDIDTSDQSRFSLSTTSPSDSAPNVISVAPTLPVANPSHFHMAVSPCDPVSEPEHNCSPRETPMETYSSAGGTPYWYYDGIPTFTDILLGQGGPTAVPHLVVRGVAQSDSTRCEIYPIIVPNYVQPNAEYLLDNLYHYHCFVDIDVTEYIVGTGPAKVTVSLHRESLYLNRLTDWSHQKEEHISFWNDPVSRTASAFEGKEMILFLRLPGSLGVEAWVTREPFNLWFIEQTPEGEIRAIAREITQARTDEQRSKMDLPLSELIKDIKEAAEERYKITNGRIGVESYLPSLITDARYMRDFYITVGATYGAAEGATVPPPPAPGEDDPDPGTVPTDEGTTVSSTPVPGAETTAPSPTDDAGLTVEQDTTTTTTEATAATAPAATETDTPVTTEGTPAVTTTEATEPATATTEPAPAEPVTGTTTTVPVVDPGEEEAAPAPNELPGEETETTTSLMPTETATTPSNDEGVPGEEDDTEPEIDDNPGEAQPTTTTLDDE